MKPKDGLMVIAVLAAAVIYIVADVARIAKEKVLRIAAGESDYERTHKRK